MCEKNAACSKNNKDNNSPFLRDKRRIFRDLNPLLLRDDSFAVPISFPGRGETSHPRGRIHPYATNLWWPTSYLDLCLPDGAQKIRIS